MARQRISEYRAKSLLFTELDLPYVGVSIDADKDIASQLGSLDANKRYIVKVDQGVKKRMKRGLIALDKSPGDIHQVIEDIKQKGFTQFLIEPMAAYDQENEKYFAIDRQREGYTMYYSSQGGIDIEEHQESVLSILIASNETLGHEITGAIGLPQETLQKLITAFDKYFFSFLEINPLVVQGDSVKILDLAVEVDTVAEFFVDAAWTTSDYTYGEQQHMTDEEKAVEELAANSQAAFTLRVLNQNGSIFMLLSGGGASIVLADEVANVGLGQELANYGEYSGNPNTEETYLYTKHVLSLLLKSTAPKKVLIVGGGVANFTDIKKTFAGLIQAFDEVKDQLRDQGVKVFVRRGGPNQEEGLALMKSYLEKESLYGHVVGPEVVLTEIVDEAVHFLR